MAVAVEKPPLVVRAPPELDALSAPGFRDQLAFLLVHGAPALVIDMRDTTFVDSSGMGALVAARKLTMEQGIEMSLHGVAPVVATALRFSGLTVFLRVTDAAE